MTNSLYDDPVRRLRQKERTVDNLNRLFAMLFSIVFAIAASALYEKAFKFLNSGVSLSVVSFDTWVMNIGSIAVLGTTAAIFFHHASRGLDLAYASSPDIVPSPIGFIVDYMVIVLQMMPFVFMARSLHDTITHVTGYFWFFVFHEFLIAFGLVLLVLQHIRHLFIKNEIPNNNEIAIRIGVQKYWFMMNAFYLFLSSLLFAIFSHSFSLQAICPLNPRVGGGIYFACTFFALAMIRNWLDFSWVWNVFYPVKGLGFNGAQIYKWPLSSFIEAKKMDVRPQFVVWPIFAGYTCIILSFVILFFVCDIADIPKWSRICSG